MNILIGVWIGAMMSAFILYLAKRNRRRPYDVLVMERRIVDVAPGEGYDFGTDLVDRQFAERIADGKGCRIVRGKNQG